MNVFHDFILLCALASIVYYALAIACAFLFERGPDSPPPLPLHPPRVALLKPLHGWDEDLLANLDSFMRLDYPDKEYIFGVTTDDDPALHALEEIKRRYPEAQIKQTVGDEPSSNRKVGKLLRILTCPTEAEILVMSDADVRVDRDYLRRLVTELDANKKTGLVTCVYRGVAPSGGIGALLEALFINTDFAPTAIVSYALEPMRHAFASTIAIRRTTLEEAGGLEAVRNSFGDDFALARRVADLGYEIRLSRSMVTMVTEQMTLRDFWDRQLRWARVDRNIRPISLARMLINGPFWALLLLPAFGFSLAGVAWAAAVIAARLTMGAHYLHKILRLPLRAADLVLLPGKDIIMQIVWIASLWGDTVEWRGRKLRLKPTGEMEEVN
ncbi:MAG TPA: glycosyltransferase [Terriglobia bacterium]|nr:glycosyltransferase [Terriglobia bacterium]